jgi:hypothetical protein
MKKGEIIEVPYFGLYFVYIGLSPFDKTKAEFRIEKPFFPLNKYSSFYTNFEDVRLVKRANALIERVERFVCEAA